MELEYTGDGIWKMHNILSPEEAGKIIKQASDDDCFLGNVDRDLLETIQGRLTEVVTAYFESIECDRQVLLSAPQLTRVPSKGIAPHDDYAPGRMMSIKLFLFSDAGELIFAQQHIRRVIIPDAGLAVMYPALPTHRHEVNKHNKDLVLTLQYYVMI